jgi:GNAT superfamily N-acetyltransferase
MTFIHGIDRIGPTDETRLAEHVRIRNAVTPDSPDSLEQIRWENATYPGEVMRLLARDGAGTAIGTATTGRIWMHGPEFERYWLGIWVVPEARRNGVGSALLAAASDAARAAGKTGFQLELSESYTDGHRFLARRGFVEIERSKAVRLELAGMAPPVADPPPGIRLATLAERPDLVSGVHRAAIETFPDIPTGDAPVDVGSLEAFTARDIDRVGIPRDAFQLAIDEATGEVVGYAALLLAPGSSTLAYHDMTAVRPPWRGRGIAMALKRATIAWAIANGVATLEAGNDEHNAPMRAVNAALGYVPSPDVVGLQGPLAPPR